MINPAVFYEAIFADDRERITIHLREEGLLRFTLFLALSCSAKYVLTERLVRQPDRHAWLSA